MKNKTKLIYANIFALIAVITILASGKILGLEIGFPSGNLLINAALILIPQMGFIYFYLLSYKLEKRKARA